MGKVTKKEINNILKEENLVDYEKLRLDVLKSLVDGRNIDCKNTKDEMIKFLKLDDQGKYIRPVVHEKHSNGKYMIGVDIKDSQNLLKITKMVESNQAQRLNLYSNDRLYYISSVKMTDLQ
jgi:hypothetical protein